MALATNKRRKTDQQQLQEWRIMRAETLPASYRSDSYYPPSQSVKTTTSNRPQTVQQPQQQNPSAVQWSPTRNAFLSLKARPKPTSPRRKLTDYTQYIDSLAGNVDEKHEKHIAAVNGVSHLDWRVKEITDLEDGSSYQSQLHRRDPLDNTNGAARRRFSQERDEQEQLPFTAEPSSQD